MKSIDNAGMLNENYQFLTDKSHNLAQTAQVRFPMCQADHACQGRNQRHCNPRYMYVVVGPQAEKSRTDSGPFSSGSGTRVQRWIGSTEHMIATDANKSMSGSPSVSEN